MSKPQLSQRIGARATAKPSQPSFLQMSTKKDVAPASSSLVPLLPPNAEDANKDKDGNEIIDHYVVRAMKVHETPDHIRARLSASLLSLSDLIRECPTLPAEPSDPTRHLSESKSADCALKFVPIGSFNFILIAARWSETGKLRGRPTTRNLVPPDYSDVVSAPRERNNRVAQSC